MSRSNIELPTDMLQIYFSDDSPCHDVNVKADSVDKLIIEKGFLKVHDVKENCWHCYNMNEISHFHYPDYVNTSGEITAEELLQEFLEASGFREEDVEHYDRFTSIMYNGKTYKGATGLFIKLKFSSDEITYFHHPALKRS